MWHTSSQETTYQLMRSLRIPTLPPVAVEGLAGVNVFFFPPGPEKALMIFWIHSLLFACLH